MSLERGEISYQIETLYLQDTVQPLENAQVGAPGESFSFLYLCGMLFKHVHFLSSDSWFLSDPEVDGTCPGFCFLHLRPGPPPVVGAEVALEEGEPVGQA